jgi:hypothetical protein
MDAVGVQRMAEPDRARPEARPANKRLRVSVIAFFFSAWLLATALQLAGGCYRADFDGYPDEAAHYITGLMVHDYLLSGNLRHPMAYAENYYVHYPKVAMGHWPPVFYVLQAAWMLLFGPSRVSILLLMAGITAAVAAVMFVAGRPQFGPWWSAGAATVFICVPMVQTYTGMVMAESLLALGGLLAAYSFAKYLETGATAPALWFGAWSAFTILVKGNGWSLVLLPPLALVLSGRASRILDWRLWAGAAVAALAVPWQLATMHMAQQGWNGSWSGQYFRMAFPAFGKIFVGNVGWGLIALALIGVAFEFFRPRTLNARLAPLPASLLSLVAAVWLFHSIVPAGVEDRKMILALPGLLLLVAAGASHLALLAGTKGAWAVAAAAIASFGFEAFTVPVKPSDHLDEVARAVRFVWPSTANRLLVAAGAASEGAFICDIAIHESRPGHFVLRATKMLASMNWNGLHERLRYPTVAATEDRIESWGVDGLIIQAGTSSELAISLLERVTDAYSDRWSPVPLPAACTGHVRLFRFTGQRRAQPSSIDIDLRRMLGRTISSDEAR